MCCIFDVLLQVTETAEFCFVFWRVGGAEGWGAGVPLHAPVVEGQTLHNLSNRLLAPGWKAQRMQFDFVLPIKAGTFFKVTSSHPEGCMGSAQKTCTKQHCCHKICCFREGEKNWHHLKWFCCFNNNKSTLLAVLFPHRTALNLNIAIKKLAMEASNLQKTSQTLLKGFNTDWFGKILQKCRETKSNKSSKSKNNKTILESRQT